MRGRPVRQVYAGHAGQRLEPADDLGDPHRRLARHDLGRTGSDRRARHEAHALVVVRDERRPGHAQAIAFQATQPASGGPATVITTCTTTSPDHPTQTHALAATRGLEVIVGSRTPSPLEAPRGSPFSEPAERQLLDVLQTADGSIGYRTRGPARSHDVQPGRHGRHEISVHAGTLVSSRRRSVRPTTQRRSELPMASPSPCTATASPAATPR
jgi:hypothetical protein